MHFARCFLFGASGAIILEMMKIWELYGKLEARKFQKVLKKYQSFVVICLVVPAGFVAYVRYSSTPTATDLDLMIAGIATRTLLREMAAGKMANQGVMLGDDDEDEVSLKDAFL